MGHDSTAVIAGLTSAEASRRLAEDGPNELPTAKPRDLFQEIGHVLREPMLLLLLSAGVVNVLLSEPLDAAILMLTVVVVVAISTYQEHKTEHALAALRELSSPRALVIRGGDRLRVAGRDVVRGDVVLIAEGDRVPADAVLVDGENLTIDESTLTGEFMPVRKAGHLAPAEAAMGQPGGDDTAWLFSGTLVVRGHGIALVKATGRATELGRIGAALQTIEPQRTPLQRELGRVVRVIAAVGVGAAAGVAVIYGTTRGHWLEGLLAGIATAMAMLPEEFPVVFTVFLAFGAWRMSQRHVLARRSAVIETLGAASVLCVDKTGTLTTNRMTVAELLGDGEVHVLDDDPLPERFHALAEFAVLASPIDPFDPMDRAFRDLAQRYLTGTEHVHENWELVREYPLSDELLALSHVWASPDRSRYVVAAKGAHEAVTDLCHLDADTRGAVAAQAEAAAADGRRVLAVGRAEFNRASELPQGQHDFPFEYLGLVTLRDPLRPGVADAVAECHRAGIRVVMITGDYLGTALAVAREVGLERGGSHLTGPELAGMSDAELPRRVKGVNVFARVVPEQKLRLVRAFQANGEVVGMTGDGVNDAPALRAADVGIAMGERGTDVAREAAALVITDDDFTSIVTGVRQGRGIFDNLRKAVSYLVAIHVLIFGMALIPVFVPDWPLVLLPIQIALFELIIDPACSIVFEAEQPDPQLMERAPRPVRQSILGERGLLVAALQGFVLLAAVLAVYLTAVFSDRSDDVVRSITFATLVAGNLGLILVNRSSRLSAWRALRERRNPTLVWIFGGAAGLLVGLLSVPSLREAFHFGPMQPADWVVAIAVAALGVSWFEFLKAAHRRRA